MNRCEVNGIRYKVDIKISHHEITKDRKHEKVF